VKIVLEIPQWAEERHIFITAGIELVAFKQVGEELKVKTSRCSMCGKCCETVYKEGPCQHLEPEGDKKVCGLGFSRPWRCCVSHNLTTPGCTEEFE